MLNLDTPKVGYNELQGNKILDVTRQHSTL